MNIPIVPCLLLIFLALSHTGWISAQGKNLVANSGFEIFEKCPEDYTPENLSHKLVPGWSYPTRATPDYFNRCSPRNVSVPKNFAGESEPHGGDGYVGAILSGTEESYREYIQGSLAGGMQKGKQYCVRFYYKLASYSRFAVDQMSLYFSDIEIKNDININLSYTPQITNKVGLFLDNIDEWEEFCTVYTATSNEHFFVIGNFRNYDNTNYVVTDKNVVNLRNKAYAYYYFDDVIIAPLENCLDCPCTLHDFESRIIETHYSGGFDPVTGKTEKIINDGSIRIGMIGGTPPYSVTWSNSMTGTELRNLPAGTYIYKAHDAYNCQSSDTVLFTEPVLVRMSSWKACVPLMKGQPWYWRIFSLNSTKPTCCLHPILSLTRWCSSCSKRISGSLKYLVTRITKDQMHTIRNYRKAGPHP
jgi:hypothetical protein